MELLLPNLFLLLILAPEFVLGIYFKQVRLVINEIINYCSNPPHARASAGWNRFLLIFSQWKLRICELF
jgi:hypothetical protein